MILKRELKTFQRRRLFSMVFALVAFFGFGFSNITDADTTTSLQGYWTFDTANILNGTLLDSSGNGYSGGVRNIATTTFYVGGQIKEAINLDGVNDYVTMGDTNDVGTGSFSINLWMKAGTNTIKGLVSKAATTIYRVEDLGTAWRVVISDGVLTSSKCSI